jgi:uncharacterized protein (TIGR03437 family)
MRCIFAAVAALSVGACALAAPPGAMLNQQVMVPASMQTDVFASPQYLMLPPGFQISVWSRLSAARFMAVAPNGDVFVSQPSMGQVTVLRPDPNGGAPTQFVYVSGLTQPQGLAFDTIDGVTWLYVGESNEIGRYVYQSGDTAAPSSRQILVTNLENNDAHPLKDVAIAPDHTLYFGYGSACNVCVTDTEVTPELAAVYSMNPDGSDLNMVASGLRNPEGLAFIPGTNTLWAAVNNRDDIPYPYNDSNGSQGQVIQSYVDNHPPEPFTSVTQGANYGWPFCNATEDSAKGYNYMAFDNDQDTNADGHVNCAAMTPIVKGLQAHSAPLGLVFMQATNFAAPYRTGAIIGYHGSWDRSVPTGYKVVYFPWSGVTQTPGDQIDFVTGFYGWGRPVDAKATADGALLISDDSSGTIYRMVWAPAAVSAASGYGILAPGSYASIYGSGLAGNSLSLTDANGQTYQAQITYTSPSQINFIVPGGAAAGAAQLVLTTGSNTLNLGTTQIAAVAPGLFSLNGSGSGTAAATAQTAGGGVVPVFNCGSSGCVETAINVGGAQVFLSLYGTGIRGAASGSVQVLANGVAVPVQYAGAQGTYPGLDQINVALPSSLAGTGEVELEVVIGSVSSNVVAVRIQ